PHSASLVLQTNDPVTATHIVRLHGETRPGQLSVTPSSLSFGLQPMGQAVARTVTVKNQGPGVIALTAAALIGAATDAFSKEGSCIDASLAAGESCELSVQYLPTTQSSHTARIRFTTGVSQSLDIALSGNSVP